MILYKAQKTRFHKCLLLDNPDRGGVSDTIISDIEKLDLEVYNCQTLQKAENILSQYNIYLIIVNVKFVRPLLEKILKNYGAVKMIIMLDTNDQKSLLNIMESPSLPHIEIVDYFFIPVDRTLILHRIRFLLNQEKEFVHITKIQLEKYIWDTIHHQTNQLHNVIWKKNYNHYILTKHIQYLGFFFHILSLLQQDYKDKSLEQVIHKTINNIELQMCFFNSYITFKTTGEYPTCYNDNVKNFLLFLIFFSELLKINMVTTEIDLNFTFKEDGSSYVQIAFDATLKPFVERYNLMHASRYHLFHYLQEYLWEHWQKTVTLQDKSDKIIVVEVLLQNKKL